jgi:hypothetical protein
MELKVEVMAIKRFETKTTRATQVGNLPRETRGFRETVVVEPRFARYRSLGRRDFEFGD